MRKHQQRLGEKGTKKRYAAMSVSDKKAKIIKNRVRRTNNRVNKEEKYKEMLPNRWSQTCDAEVPKRPTTRSATQGTYIYFYI